MKPTRITALKNYHDEHGNRIVYSGNHVETEVDIQFYGGGNRLVVAPNARLEKIVVEFRGRDAEIDIGACNARCAILVGSGSNISIGKGLSTTGAVYMTAFEGSSIHIGEDCMFAGNVQIRADDAHPIFDVETGKRCNIAMPVVIGDHVWLGEGCVVLGSSEVGAGSVVGMRSLVKGKIPNNCIVAGVPARVVRKNVAWERPHLSRESLFSFDGTLKDMNKEYWHYSEE
ncbi:acyltransferase [Burkholderia anthina]|uniref:acyltransferase n=1 Tax=Burkholderia anthina TaxID=179879 RepID=UPI00158BE55D|nr:acyltransferase [Burkholderia anthina]